MPAPEESPRARDADDGSVAGAAERAYRAGHQLVLDRVELLALEAREASTRASRSGGYAVLACGSALVAWLCAARGIVVALDGVLPELVTLLLLVGAHVALARWAARRASSELQPRTPS